MALNPLAGVGARLRLFLIYLGLGLAAFALSSAWVALGLSVWAK